MANDTGIVIIGGGIAGASLATVLSRNGLSVLLLEKTLIHRDIVRGEFLAPWGVEEVAKLGLLDLLLAAGAHYTTKSVPYGEGTTPEEARARTLALANLVPGVPGAMTFGHPQICQALDDSAVASGATLLRGITELEVTAGASPKLSFMHDGRRHEVTPRLIVGADGRGSAVARQVGLRSETDPEHHLIAGMIVESPDAWSDDEYSIGNEGDVTFYVFPQANNRTRLYLCYGLNQSTRFSGTDRERKFLDAFRLSSLPQSEMFASALPLGPCHGYPNADRWIDTPHLPGIVLVGDAAGHNDPTIGQGLAIAFRDVRLVSEALVGNPQWANGIFMSYAEERRERMRRLRFAAHQFSIWRAEFTEEARARRQRSYARIAADPSFQMLLLPPLKGPFAVPDYVFEQAAWDSLLN